MYDPGVIGLWVESKYLVLPLLPVREIENDLLNELLHFFRVGTRRFSTSNQFSTTLICVGTRVVKILERLEMAWLRI